MIRYPSKLCMKDVVSSYRKLKNKIIAKKPIKLELPPLRYNTTTTQPTEDFMIEKNNKI